MTRAVPLAYLDTNIWSYLHAPKDPSWSGERCSRLRSALSPEAGRRALRCVIGAAVFDELAGLHDIDRPSYLDILGGIEELAEDRFLHSVAHLQRLEVAG